MRSEKDKIISLIERTPQASEEWIQAATKRANHLMAQGSANSLLHTLSATIPPERWHGKHTVSDIDNALNFEEDFLKHFKSEGVA